MRAGHANPVSRGLCSQAGTQGRVFRWLLTGKDIKQGLHPSKGAWPGRLPSAVLWVWASLPFLQSIPGSPLFFLCYFKWATMKNAHDGTEFHALITSHPSATLYMDQETPKGTVLLEMAAPLHRWCLVPSVLVPRVPASKVHSHYFAGPTGIGTESEFFNSVWPGSRHRVCLWYGRLWQFAQPRPLSLLWIKIAGRNVNNLRYADDTTLMAESEEELKSLLMRVKEEGENVGLKLT